MQKIKYDDMISIILPSYNRASLIKQTIESCLNQTYPHFELIIVDDCSTDNSAEIIQKYLAKDSRIKFIQNKVNKKLPATLNIGFAAAKGKYFTWISDDNYFAPNAIELMVTSLNNNPEIGLVYADYITVDAQNKVISRIYQEEPEFLPIRDCVGACFLYRANIAKKVGLYNEQLFLIEDYEYWLRMGLTTQLLHIPKPLYFYRLHGNSLTKTRMEEIRIAKNNLKNIYSLKYKIPQKLKPINDLYIWFIGKRNIYAYFKLIIIIIKNPVICLSYILKNLRRMKE